MKTKNITKSSQAYITDVQRFSVYDGPGIRTLIYFKGCPLRCIWCQNPETQNAGPEIMCSPDDCIGCGKCVEVCSTGAMGVDDGKLRYRRSLCTGCGECLLHCYAGARKTVGELVDLEHLVRVALSDRVFFQNTGGGVTLGGGEPTVHPDIVVPLLRRLQEEGVHTAIETCGHCNSAVFDEIVRHCDLVLFDIKHMDSEQHRRYTGVGNERILDNFERICAGGKDVVIRLPLIPGINDDARNLERVAALAGSNQVYGIHILPFHQMGLSKWTALDHEYQLADMLPADASVAERAEKILRASGVPINIGGSSE